MLGQELVTRGAGKAHMEVREQHLIALLVGGTQNGPPQSITGLAKRLASRVRLIDVSASLAGRLLHGIAHCQMKDFDDGLGQGLAFQLLPCRDDSGCRGQELLQG